MSWQVHLTFEIHIEYEGSRLKWVARNNRNHESATALLREEIRAAIDGKLDEMRAAGVGRWTILAPASSVRGT